jgi:hypothetical protein
MRQIEARTEALTSEGYVVLRGLFGDPVIEEARDQVLRNLALFRNTRPNPSSGHLAGFHRYPALGPLHDLLAGNETILAVLARAANCRTMRSIGLTDITVNRSQEWHVDLLRGRYRHHLDDGICWGEQGGGVYKALLYLQPGASLKVVPGGHARPIALDSDAASRPQDPNSVASVAAGPGDVILTDIRLPHRGSTEEELAGQEHRAAPKILVSTVLGAETSVLTCAMERGNFERLMDWDEKHRQARTPELA